MDAKDTKIIIEPMPLERALEEAYKLGIRGLVDKFNELADEMAESLAATPTLSERHMWNKNGRISSLNWAKQNLGRLAKEVLKKC